MTLLLVICCRFGCISWFHRQNLAQRCHHYILDIIVGMGQALQVLGTGFPALHECCHASFTSVCSTKAWCDHIIRRFRQWTWWLRWWQVRFSHWSLPSTLIMKFLADWVPLSWCYFVILNFYILELGKNYEIGETFGTTFKKRKTYYCFSMPVEFG